MQNKKIDRNGFIDNSLLRLHNTFTETKEFFFQLISTAADLLFFQIVFRFRVCFTPDDTWKSHTNFFKSRTIF